MVQRNLIVGHVGVHGPIHSLEVLIDRVLASAVAEGVGTAQVHVSPQTALCQNGASPCVSQATCHIYVIRKLSLADM